MYHYAANNPVKYTDPDGQVPFHFRESIGWSHHAPQRWFGYFDFYDGSSVFMIFNINGTRINGKDFTVRMWKGTYGTSGVGCEIGIYSPRGRSFNRNDLKVLGIESSSLVLKDDKGNVILKKHENKPSFWTTGFNPLKHKHKDKLTAIFSFNFSSEEKALAFYNQISDDKTKENAEEYYWNGKGKVDISLSGDKKSVIFTYGVRD